MQDIKTEIVYGATVAVPKEEINLAKGDVLQWKKDRMSQELGMKISDEKGWYDHDDGKIVMSDIRLYVFTPAELMTYLDARFKKRLREMAANEEYLTDEQREALIIQSERF